jgi:trigger factor
VALVIGKSQFIPGFEEGLRGTQAGEERTVEASFPADYPVPALAGKAASFAVKVKEVGRPLVPELNDEFAKQVGEFETLDALKQRIREGIGEDKKNEAERTAKDKIVDELVDANDFPVPEAFVEKQIENRVEQRLRTLAGEGIDPRSLNLDWSKLKESQRDRALREVKASLLLGKIAEREAIVATQDEVDREVERLARQEREPVAALRKKMSENGTLDRLASHIQTEKVLNFLFEHATKTAE